MSLSLSSTPQSRCMPLVLSLYLPLFAPRRVTQLVAPPSSSLFPSTVMSGVYSGIFRPLRTPRRSFHEDNLKHTCRLFTFLCDQIVNNPHVMQTRPCDDMVCRICLDRISSRQKGCVAAVPSKRLARMAKKTIAGMMIKWDCSVSCNSFHWQCWERGKLSTAREFAMGRKEKALISVVEETVDIYDDVEHVDAVATAFADILASSNRIVCFTGAGISAAAGIPTYRGSDGIDTIDALGGAVKRSCPTDEADGATAKRIRTTGTGGLEQGSWEDSDEEDDVPYENLQPTVTHLALSAMNRMGKMNYCITQNCDDLHHKGGFPRDCLSELHGNVFCEYCEKCGAEYFRDYSVDEWSTDCHKESWWVKCRKCSYNHYTSRLCTVSGCKGKLRDTIVNFGDDLHSIVLGGYPRAEEMCKKADVCLCLGSSLTVSPANELPTYAKDVVICNPQITDLDSFASLVVRATSDMFMSRVMKILEDKERLVSVHTTTDDGGPSTLRSSDVGEQKP